MERGIKEPDKQGPIEFLIRFRRIITQRTRKLTIMMCNTLDTGPAENQFMTFIVQI